MKKIIAQFGQISTVRAVQLAQLARQGGVLVTSVLLAKSAWGSVNIGVFELLLFLGGTARFFWMNALLQGLLSFAPRVRDYPRERLFVQVFYLLFFFNLITFGLTILLKPVLLGTLTGKPDLAFFGIFSWFLLFNLPAFLLETVYQLQNRPIALLIFSWTSQILQIGWIGGLILGGGHFSQIFDGLVAIGLVRFGWLMVEIFWKKNLTDAPIFAPDWATIGAFGRFCLPLVGYALLNGLATNFDAILVNWFYGGDPSVFAVFRYGAREFPLILALSLGLSNGFVPILAKKMLDSDVKNADLYADLKRQTRRLWAWIFGFSAVVLVFSDWIYVHVFSGDFLASSAIFKVYLLLIFSRSLFPQTILLGLGDNKAVFVISILENVVNIGLSYFLITKFGLIGVAFGTVVAFLFEKILIGFYIWKRYKISFSSYTDWRVLALYWLGFGVLFWLFF